MAHLQSQRGYSSRADFEARSPRAAARRAERSSQGEQGVRGIQPRPSPRTDSGPGRRYRTAALRRSQEGRQSRRQAGGGRYIESSSDVRAREFARRPVGEQLRIRRRNVAEGYRRGVQSRRLRSPGAARQPPQPSRSRARIDYGAGRPQTGRQDPSRVTAGGRFPPLEVPSRDPYGFYGGRGPIQGFDQGPSREDPYRRPQF